MGEEGPYHPPMPAPITVYVAEDHPVFREAVARAIEAHTQLELVGSSADGGVALEELRELVPTVALLDYRLPARDGLEILAGLQQARLPTRVVILTGEGTSDAIYDAVTLGAAGFLTKQSTMAEICAAVVAAADGDTVLAPSVQAGLVSELRARELGERTELTPRELEVLRLVAEGLTSPQIAERLQIRSSTVKTHVQNLFEKLGVSDRAAAVAAGMRRGLVE
jgi:two-component system, NarL family, nitrate/nitrite response regulator NarL